MPVECLCLRCDAHPHSAAFLTCSCSFRTCFEASHHLNVFAELSDTDKFVCNPFRLICIETSRKIVTSTSNLRQKKYGFLLLQYETEFDMV